MKTVKRITIKADRVKVAEDAPLYKVAGQPIVSPDIVADMVADMVRALIGATDAEHFIVIPVDVRNRPLGVELVAVGSVDACPVDPRSVFRSAILLAASAIVIVHNHPSGDTTPSAEDKRLTERLVKGAKILGLQILDHVIVTDDNYYSLAEAGEMGA